MNDVALNVVDNCEY